MKNVHFANDAFEELMEWAKVDKKTLQRIARMVEECRRTPKEGIGKPEALRSNLSGYWSRRIDEKNRLIYQFSDDELTVFSLKGHYDDR